MDGSTVTVFMEQGGKLLDLLRRQLGPQLKMKGCCDEKDQSSKPVEQMRKRTLPTVVM